MPSDYAFGVFEAIWAEGEKRGAVAYGLDALLALRAEKGFIIVGQETDGTVTADDLGMGRMVAMSKPDFVGKRSLALPDLARDRGASSWLDCSAKTPRSRPTRARRSSPTPSRRLARPRSVT